MCVASKYIISINILLCILLSSCQSNKRNGDYLSNLSVNAESFTRVYRDITKMYPVGSNENDYLYLKQQSDSIKELWTRPYILIMSPIDSMNCIEHNQELLNLLQSIFDKWIEDRCSIIMLPVEYVHYYSYNWRDWEHNVFESIDNLILCQYSDSINAILSIEYPGYKIGINAERVIPDETIQKIIDREVADLVDEKLGELLSIASTALTTKYQIELEQEIAYELSVAYEECIYIEAISKNLLE